MPGSGGCPAAGHPGVCLHHLRLQEHPGGHVDRALTCAEATHTELEVGGVYYGEVKRENGRVLSARLYDMAALYQLAGLVGTMRDSKTAEQVFHQLIWMNEHRED